ncbi:MAG: di-trans,poly-cis-decaprenylcistransferase [Candidatus Lloydbacteria bacterium RIFCSPHIGHO2_02_FULL_51_22]|uniref:Isoprenyl transferase n=2 Tax=Candidatus Lloydiibacteriota TaxID=1817910 RepID=A0A1G2DEE1_9BACT|nr:MAG: di-trans,poly-cis-decaprenylcistransferase [Candidatus Lloydbacteria bacterium RIFCSPHIGHO2_02_FULL_51_22]OGZ14068.1 MAG: di-trans,poly-cis-decaprenylcistransferase [Candidatus Lloydbacteria bacterium RIFCSPLOWO2_02_FULL_51_11]
METPKCIGVIMDGNRRWARSRGLSSAEGHLAGYEKLKQVARWMRNAGVKHLIAFALSTENWARAEEEVGALMDLCRLAFKDGFDELMEERIRVRIIGDRERFPKDIQTLISEMEKRVEENNELWGSGCGDEPEDDVFDLVLALSYGGRQEIEMAAWRLATESLRLGISPVSLRFANFLETTMTGIPDPDIIIRPGGEMRDSGFLPFQSVYSERFFSKTLWPNFSGKEFLRILVDYDKRKRNFGR